MQKETTVSELLLQRSRNKSISSGVRLSEQKFSIVVSEGKMRIEGAVEEEFNLHSLDALLKEKNHYFFSEMLPELIDRYKNFHMPVLMDDEGYLIIDSHTYIKGVWYFDDRDTCVKQASVLHTHYPELLRQADSELIFGVQKNKITELSYKLYINDVEDYPVVPEEVAKFNIAQFTMLTNEALTLSYGYFEAVKDEYGRLIEFTRFRRYRFR